ncbi:MAG TPA: class I SAM-dependent methyltransferase [Anaerolineae bacterium]|nr:class I SAM-dependent methyltransferase [Anaerolineae bacterium]
MVSVDPVATITGNYFDKHQSRNPLVRALVGGYRQTLQGLIANLPLHTALEIGSGEGHLIEYIQAVRPDLLWTGSDITYEMVKVGRMNVPDASWSIHVGEALPFHDASFDVVLACEVLEHVRQPALVLQEMSRVSVRYGLVSVPWEPWWRILNVLRGKYLRHGGNTPGHLNHWSRRGVLQLVSTIFHVSQVHLAVPWVFLLAEKRSS